VDAREPVSGPCLRWDARRDEDEPNNVRALGCDLSAARRGTAYRDLWRERDAGVTGAMRTSQRDQWPIWGPAAFSPCVTNLNRTVPRQ